MRSSDAYGRGDPIKVMVNGRWEMVNEMRW